MNLHAPVIDVTDVSFRFPSGLLTLDTVSITVHQDEIVALIGPSGCGKTTLLNAVAGLLEPTAGVINIDGNPSVPRLGHFSYLPQRDCLLPWRSALDNAALLMEVRGVPKREARAQAGAMLEEFGMSDFAAALPAALSGGMRQRIALMRTFLPGRNILMDEPFSALDAITRGDLHEWLLGVRAVRGTSILMVTHDIDEALFLADRVYVMSARPGRTVFELETGWPMPRTLSITASHTFVQKKCELLEILRDASRESERSWVA